MNALINMLVRLVKNKFVSLVIVGGCVLFAVNTYKEKQLEIENLRQSTVLEQQKNEVLKEISQLDVKYSQIKATINSKDKANSAVMYSLSNLGKDASIKISYIRPVGEEKSSVLTKGIFEISLTAPDYHKLGKFVSAIESAPELYTVEDLEITGSGEESVTARLTVSTIVVK